jgi:hypothetical protein
MTPAGGAGDSEALTQGGNIPDTPACDDPAMEPSAEDLAALNLLVQCRLADVVTLFFGKGGEVATNRLEDQKLSVLALHLLQASLVYVNTWMLQRVLDEPVWLGRMAEDDMRALSPLVYAHVSPYGTFDLNLDERLDLGAQVA